MSVAADGRDGYARNPYFKVVARYGLVDYEKAFTPDSTVGDIFDLRSIARDEGRARRRAANVRKSRPWFYSWF